MSEEDSLDAVINIMKIKRLVKETDEQYKWALLEFYEKVKEIVEE